MDLYHSNFSDSEGLRIGTNTHQRVSKSLWTLSFKDIPENMPEFVSFEINEIAKQFKSCSPVLRLNSRPQRYFFSYTSFLETDKINFNSDKLELLDDDGNVEKAIMKLRKLMKRLYRLNN